MTSESHSVFPDQPLLQLFDRFPFLECPACVCAQQLSLSYRFGELIYDTLSSHDGLLDPVPRAPVFLFYDVLNGSCAPP